MKAFRATRVKLEVWSFKNKMSTRAMGIKVETNGSGAKAN
jgi:hypothetical protein